VNALIQRSVLFLASEDIPALTLCLKWCIYHYKPIMLLYITAFNCGVSRTWIRYNSYNFLSWWVIDSFLFCFFKKAKFAYLDLCESYTPWMVWFIGRLLVPLAVILVLTNLVHCMDIFMVSMLAGTSRLRGFIGVEA